MRYTRTKSTCGVCPLSSKIKILSEGPEDDVKHNKIVFLSGAPDEASELQKKPFVGKSGEFFTWALGEVGLRRDRSWLMNIINCRPPKNDIGGFEGEEARICCAQGLKEELTWLYSRGYRVIVAQGNEAVSALGLRGKLHTIRGSVYTGEVLASSGLPPYRVIPTFDPKNLISRAWSRDSSGTVDPTHIYISDLEKAIRVSDESWKEQKENFDLIPSFSRLCTKLRSYMERRPLLAVDIETTGLSSHTGEIVVIGLADGAESGISIPLCTRHPADRYWGRSEEPVIRELLSKVFETCPLAFQNAFFDVPFLRAKGFRVPLNIAEDTLLLHSVIDPELPHDLGFIVSMYGDTPYWKEEFKNRPGSIFELDPEEMRRYNLRDCVVIHQILPRMLARAKELNVLNEYRKVIMALVPATMTMQERGVLFDQTKQKAFKTTAEKILQDLDKQLRELGKLPPTMSLSSDDELRYFLFGDIPAKFARLTGILITYDKQLKAKTKETTKFFEGEVFESLPEEWKTIAKKHEVCYSYTQKKEGTDTRKDYEDLTHTMLETKPLYLLNGYGGTRTDSKKRSVGADALLSYRIALTKKLDEQEKLVTPKEDVLNAIGDLLNWLTLLEQYTSYDKLFSAFTRYKPASDGRIHSHWNLHGTSTGRMSCSGPNLMQLPKEGEGKVIRKFFIAPPGKKFISADYENAEVALLGCETLDKGILDAYYGGHNIHDDNTRILFNIEPEHEKWKLARAAAKVFQFGGLSYGGGDREIYRKIMLKAPDLGLTFKDFVEAKTRWMDAHPAYVTWKNEVERLVLRDRKVYNEFGRVRLFLSNEKDIVKEAMNFKIQSAGASVINRALIRIYDILEERKLESFPVLQIHDQLVFECPDAEVEIMKEIIRDEMTRPFMYKGFERFLRIDLSVGSTLGDLE